MAAKIVCSSQFAVCSWQFCKRHSPHLPIAYCRLPTLLLWIFFIQASHSESIAMTNKEILHADLLDILFENRNKAYGAYALRRNYNHRLQWALGISLSFVFLLLIIQNYGMVKIISKEPPPDVTLIPVDLSKPKIPDPPKPKVEPPRKQVAYTDQIKIDPYKTEMPEETDMMTSDISNKTGEGTD